MPFKRKFRVFNFAKSIKIREIRENMYTRKLVHLRYSPADWDGHCDHLRGVCPSLVADLKKLAHHPNVTSLSLFYRHYFGRCLSELAEKVQLPHSDGTSIRYSYTFHSYSVTIPGCYKNVFVKSFYP